MTDPKSAELSAIFYPGSIKRPHYFTGMVLGADDFTAEFEYHRGKLRRHILRFHGYGIVDGLKVSVQKDPSSWVVVIAPGLAIDPFGNEIELCTKVKLPLSAAHSAVELRIRFSERLCDPAPVLNSETGTQPTRVEEGYEVFLLPISARTTPHSKANDAGQNGLPIARLLRTRSVWRVDRTFKSRRVH